MKIDKKQLRLLTVILCLIHTVLYAQNNCLDFDGDDDLVQTSLTINNTDFTIELWFKSDNANTSPICNGNFKRLFNLLGSAPPNNYRFEVGECGGNLSVFWSNTTGSFGPFSLGGPNVGNDGLWHHLAVVRSGNIVEVFLDCISIYSNTAPGDPVIGTMNVSSLSLGRVGFGVFPNQTWLGQMDDFRLWNSALTLTEIDDQKNCLLTGTEPGLEVYWPLDEGTPAGNNTAISQVVDLAGNDHPGNVSNFCLGDPVCPPANQSNFITSGATLIYPNYNGLDLEIRDYPYRSNLLTEICNGDPAHFCLFDNGQTPPPNSNITVNWEYSDDGGLIWNSLVSPPFTDFCFAVPSGNILMDCSINADGFVDRKYRAISTLTNAQNACEYISDEYDLRICCPISSSTTVVIQPPNPLCEGEMLTLNVALNSPDPFVNNPGPNVTIDWCLNGVPIVPALPPNATSFNYNFTAPAVTTPTNFCFEAKITNCALKSSTFSSCIRVDPEPKCGQIIGLPSPPNLVQVSPSPNPVYTICPGNDATLGIAPAFPFTNCNPQWQYSFDQLTWFTLGFSNTVQNTNSLPISTLNWPVGTTSIFYRIQCLPLVNPSACDPCFGDTLEIQLIPDPLPASITGLTEICKGDIAPLSVVAPVPGETYQWLCNGLAIGTGTTYNATMNGCYWLASSNGCKVVESLKHCVDVCEVLAKLSCPLPPNECACLGDPITISACDSEYTCDPGLSLNYVWYIDGVLSANTGCMLTDTPPVVGATYRVEVTEPISGCTGVRELFIKPCDKQ